MLKFFLWLLRLIYFRKVRTTGLKNLEGKGPLLIVANHVNGLLDPLLLYVHLPRRPRFLAKASLFKHPFVAPFLKAARALPVTRRKDGPVDIERNQATFDACVHALLAGDVVALFPEGVSHNEPRVQPLRTGAARITGLAWAHGVRVTVVPVGLIYSARAIFRSEALVIAGPPVTYQDLPWGDGENPEAVRVLTARIAEALAGVTVNAERWLDLDIVETLRRLAINELDAAKTGGEEPCDRRALLERFYGARFDHPVEMTRLLKAARRYMAILKALGLRDEDLAMDASGFKAFNNAAKGFVALVLGMAPAFYGWLFHVIPYTLTGIAAKLLAKSEDTSSTYKLYAGLVLYPSCYLLQLGLAAQALGVPAAVAIGIAAVPAGFWAVRYSEQREEYVQAAWAVLTLRTRRRTAEKLLKIREEVKEALRPLLYIYR